MIKNLILTFIFGAFVFNYSNVYADHLSNDPELVARIKQIKEDFQYDKIEDDIEKLKALGIVLNMESFLSDHANTIHNKKMLIDKLDEMRLDDDNLTEEEFKNWSELVQNNQKKK